MKMWFPNRLQWIMLWLGLTVSFLLWPFYPLDSWNAPGIRGREGYILFIAIAVIFIVWMIQGRKPKSKP